MSLRTLDPPANGIQAFDLGPELFKQYRRWRRKGLIVVDRVRAGTLVLVFWRHPD